MRRDRPLVVAVCCLLACLLALAPAADARTAPAFIGVNLDGPAVTGEVPIETQMRAISRAGAGSVRWSVEWDALQPFRTWSDVPAARRAEFTDAGGAPFDFRSTDRLIAAASRNGLSALPVVLSSARWVAENPFVPFSPPMDMAAYGHFVGVLAKRYGPRGSFWSARPDVPKRPLRVWQIWNEPAGFHGFGSPTVFWTSTRDALHTYAEMLAAARRGLSAADPRAKILLAGLFGESWVSLEQLYAMGARGTFDAVAVHPYTRKPKDVLRILTLMRGVMWRFGDGGLPIAVTEMSWPSSLGRADSSLTIPVSRARQGPVLRRAYRLLARHRKRFKLRGVFWYTWMSRDASPTESFDYSGLVTAAPGGGMVPKPALKYFRRTARELTARR